MTTKIDGITWVAVACLVLGWFWLDTLAATFGPVQHAVHFYDLPLVMRDPRWLLTGVTDAYPLIRVVFGLVCLVVITAPLLLLFLGAQRRFIEGVTLSGMKG